MTKSKFRLPFVCLIAFLSFGIVGATAADNPPPKAEFFTSRPLPLEGQDVALVLRVPSKDSEPEQAKAHLRICDSREKVVFQRDIPLKRSGNTLEGSVSWRPEKNGLYLATVSGIGDKEHALEVPVLDKERDLDFAWWSYYPWMRWATVLTIGGSKSTLCERGRERGIKVLEWKYGSNYPGIQEQELTKEALIAAAKKYYTPPADAEHDGWGCDEFGAYPSTPAYTKGMDWLRGIGEAKKESPNLYIAAWHAGTVRDDWLGVYRETVDLVLLETYVMYYIPDALASENIYQDIRHRLMAVRRNDLFTRVYGSPCKALLALGPCGAKGTYTDPAEMEQVFRFVRREFPEMRGIGIFNTSDSTEQVMRAAHDLCFEYFIKPVVTFQAESLWVDRFKIDVALVAAVSNIGAMDSGPVTVRVKVNGKVVGTKRLESVPAGHSRLDNRAFVRFDWRPSHQGRYDLVAEILDAPGSTVLEAIVCSQRLFAQADVDKTGK